jgi:hypothetical protein
MDKRYAITPQRLKEIISEEIKNHLMEDVDYEGVKKVVTLASKLLSAIKSTKSDVTGAMTNALMPHLEELEKTLESMINNPASYVDKPPAQQKVVKLRKIVEP